jgi:hypothetical protein
MDTELIKTVTGLLTSGGSAAVIFLVYIAYTTLQRMRRAADEVTEIRNAIVSAAPLVSQGARDLREVVASVKEVDGRLSRQELQIAAALHRPFTTGASGS